MKQIALSCLLILAVYSSYCQVSFGLKSGINIATTKGIIEYPKNRLGWYLGGDCHIKIDKQVILCTELLYSSKGYSYIDFTDGKKGAMRLNYFSVPILINYKIDTKTHINFGPELGYLISATNCTSNKENINATSSFPSKFDIGLDIGIAYSITKRFGSEIRYCYGFKTFYQTDNAGIQRGDTKGANRLFQFGLFYTLKN